MALIEPRTLKGFRDYLPEQMIPRERLVETARKVYRSYGFLPIDTPALEYEEILTGKGGEESDKQLYAFEDHGGRRVALRFDLTVPLARFVAQHSNELGMPFKRYHIASVWRGENTQRGRYREFMQCDFDTIGTESNAADIETLFVIHDLLTAIGFERFTVRINNRLLLNGLLQKQGLADKAVGILRSLDKLAKIGGDAVVAEMTEKVGATNEQARAVLELAAMTGSPDDLCLRLEPMLAGSDDGLRGVSRLRELFAAVRKAGIPSERVALDLSIARGLDYYTGTIYETILADDPKIGSVCSGGRYDNLAALFTNQKLAGVGASLGLDRLLAAMESFGMIAQASTPAPVLIIHFDNAYLGEYLALGRTLRAAGIATEVYPDYIPVGKQFKYADRKGFRIALVAGSDEFTKGVWQVKGLAERTQTAVATADLPATLQAALATA